jgi:uncharacterized membrane protein
MKNTRRRVLVNASAIVIVLLGTCLFLQMGRLSYSDFTSDREQLEGTPQRDLARVIACEEPILDRLLHPGALWENPERGDRRDSHQVVVMKIITGAYKGRLLAAENILHFKPSANAVVRKGTIVRVSYVPLNDRLYDPIILKPVVRFPFVAYCAAILLVLLIVLARLRGVAICISLVLAGFMTYYMLIPLMVWGYPPVAVVLVFSFLLACIVFIIVGQFNLKGLSAGIGAAGGLLVAFLIAVLFSHALDLSGIFSTKSRFLSEVLERQQVQFDLVAFIVASSAVCILGIVIDVGISIASGVHQLHIRKPDSSRGALFKAGLNISRDVTGTMVITLIFAYLGLQIHSFYLMEGAFLTPREFLNSESVSVELIQVLCGAIGVLLSGPLAALAATFILPRARKSEAEKEKPTPEDGASRRREKIFLAIEGALIFALIALIGYGATEERAYYLRIGLPTDTENVVQSAGDTNELKAISAAWLQDFYFDDALYALLHAGKTAEEDAEIHRDLAYLYVQKKFLIPAHAEVSRAIALGAQDTKTYYTAGVANLWLHRDDEARMYLEKALILDPDNQEVKLALEMLGRIDESAPGEPRAE